MAKGNRSGTTAPERPGELLPARVISVSRRNVKLLLENRVVEGVSSRALKDVTVGDMVAASPGKDKFFIEEILPRKNCLARSYREQQKSLASNLDHVFIVTAVESLFQPLFIDRVIGVCRSEDIPVTLVVNKADLPAETTVETIEIYKELKIPIHIMSVKKSLRWNEFLQLLANPQLNVVALAGVSGVGKSTILNKLVPEASRRTGEVSRKTGLGIQTTTLAVGYEYKPEARVTPLLVIDLPGVQSFGVAHLSKDGVIHGFSEIEAIGRKCKFGNCSHMAEEECEVKVALEDGRIAFFRYESYCRMIEEIKEARKY